MMEKENRKRTIDTSDNDNTTSKRTKLDLMEACVKLITIHGRPMSLIEDKAFRDIIHMIPLTLRTNTINSHTVREKIIIEANAVRTRIAHEIKGRLICVKVDTATCMGRSFLGINIQFVKSKKLHIRTLGVIELFHRHTAEYLKHIILKICQNFNILNKQIYTITVDNGANMLKTAQLLNETEETENSEDVIIESPLLDIEEDIEESISMNTNNNCEEHVNTVRCAAHTLQLSITDFLKQEEITTALEKIRTVVKKLRTPICKSTLTAMFGKNAILDCSTRWNSTLDMLQRLYEIKEYCDQIDDEHLKLPQITWNKISEIVEVLTPPKVATKRLQSEQLFLGDLYEIWERCIMQTSKVDSEYAAIIVRNMKNREAKLFENPIFISGIFMDPRYNVILEEPMIQKAKHFLIHIYERIQKVAPNVPNSSAVQRNNTNENTADSNADVDEFERMLRKAESIRAVSLHDNNMLQYLSLENEIEID